jgi:hypothetical protein
MEGTRIAWSRGSAGGVLVASEHPRTLYTATDLARWVRGRYGLLGDRQLELLGAVALYFAIREAWEARPGEVIATAMKALEDLDLAVPDPIRQRTLEQGIQALCHHLFPHRAEDGVRLGMEAHDFVVERLERLGEGQ